MTDLILRAGKSPEGDALAELRVPAWKFGLPQLPQRNDGWRCCQSRPSASVTSTWWQLDGGLSYVAWLTCKQEDIDHLISTHHWRAP